MCKLLKLQVLTPRLQFVMYMLEEVALLSCDMSRLVLAADPVSLARFVLRLFDTSSSGGRRNLAHILCLMMNVQITGGREEQGEAVQ